MATKTNEEKLQDIEQKMAQLKKQKRLIQNKAKSEERKARNHRLIQIGGEVEKYCGEITDLEAFAEYVKQYSGAIKRTQQPKTAPTTDAPKFAQRDSIDYASAFSLDQH